MVSDRVQRLNPTTGEVTEYLLPKHTNIRRVFVDKGDHSGALWVGSNHGSSVIKVEALDQ